MRYLTDNELSFHDRERAFMVGIELMEEGYVVMFSEEESLTILNYIPCFSYKGEPYADRNDVVFQSRDIFEEELFEVDED